MQSRLGAVRTAVVLAAVAAAAAGCSSGGSGKASSSSGAGANAAQELAATVKNAQSINSFTAAMSVQGNGIPGAGNLALNGTFTEQRQPAELARFDVSSIQASGANLGPMSTITTPSALYLKMPMISSLTHSAKPYIKIPVSALKSGGGLSALIGQAQSSNPLSAAQLLAGATNTRTVGTGTVNGVSVTELEGSEPVSAALAKLPANVRSSFGQNIQKLGVRQIKYQAWVDGQHNFRKLIINEVGSAISETVTMTVTSINQPVHISVPSASQVSTLPASALRGASGM